MERLTGKYNVVTGCKSAVVCLLKLEHLPLVRIIVLKYLEWLINRELYEACHKTEINDISNNHMTLLYKALVKHDSFASMKHAFIPQVNIYPSVAKHPNIEVAFLSCKDNITFTMVRYFYKGLCFYPFFLQALLFQALKVFNIIIPIDSTIPCVTRDVINPAKSFIGEFSATYGFSSVRTNSEVVCCIQEPIGGDPLHKKVLRLKAIPTFLEVKNKYI